MNFATQNIYHIYNRGNNKQIIFFKRDNYIYFLNKIRRYILPNCEILAYCLMPNHFHLLVYVDERLDINFENPLITNNKLSEGIRLLLSSYTKGINVQEQRIGNLFQQKTKARCVTENNSQNYSEECFHYIHQNPIKANLVDKMEDWEFSSFQDYSGLRNGNLCNQALAFKLLEVKKENFYNDSYNVRLPLELNIY